MRKRDLIAAAIGAPTATVLAGRIAWAAIGDTALAWNHQGPEGADGAPASGQTPVAFAKPTGKEA